MKLVSVNIGQPKEVVYQEKTLKTGIYKYPVSHAVSIHKTGVGGDVQVDTKHHGGIEKAVYIYPAEYYDFWRNELPETDFPLGAFGENLTITGAPDTQANIGDVFKVGEVELQVTMPRIPCYKLNIRFDSNLFLKKFYASQHWGFYCSVLKEGAIQIGDKIELLKKDEDNFTVADFTQLYTSKIPLPELLAKALNTASLSEKRKEKFRVKFGG